MQVISLTEELLAAAKKNDNFSVETNAGPSPSSPQDDNKVTYFYRCLSCFAETKMKVTIYCALSQSRARSAKEKTLNLIILWMPILEHHS